MHQVTLAVILAAVAATAWLAQYVFFYLPKRMEDQYRESMKAFSKAIELRFPSHAGLSMRVAALSQAVGARMNLGRRRLIDLEMAAILRDIGLCAVPYALVNGKARETWSESELNEYERHGEISGSMLDLVPHLKHLAPIVRNHHVDYRIHAELGEIFRSAVPTESYILNAVSAYVWIERLEGPMTAREHLRQCAGSKFEPMVVAALFDVLPSLRVGTRDGETAVRR